MVVMVLCVRDVFVGVGGREGLLYGVGFVVGHGWLE